MKGGGGGGGGEDEEEVRETLTLCQASGGDTRTCTPSQNQCKGETGPGCHSETAAASLSTRKENKGNQSCV